MALRWQLLSGAIFTLTLTLGITLHQSISCFAMPLSPIAPRLVDTRCEPQGADRLVRAVGLRADVDEHERLAVAAQARLQQVSQLAVPGGARRQVGGCGERGVVVEGDCD